jgi:putative regulator of septum formation
VRHKLAGAALPALTGLVLAGLVLAGCAGRPAGVDGDLVNNWSAMPEAKLPVPAEHACYHVHVDAGDVETPPPPVECANTHSLETIHVGTFAGADAGRADPPPAGGPGQRAAYQECAAAAKSFLGDDWRTGRVDLLVALPSTVHWGAGARWFRCDLIEYQDLNGYEVVERAGSMQGSLRPGQPLRLGCFTVTSKDDAIDVMTAVACTASHNAEFAGVFDAPDGPYPGDEKQRRALDGAGCRAVIAAFAAIPNDRTFQYRTGFISAPYSRSEWEQGNRGVRCYIWPGRTLSRSLRGAGTGALPINYA